MVGRGMESGKGRKGGRKDVFFGNRNTLPPKQGRTERRIITLFLWLMELKCSKKPYMYMYLVQQSAVHLLRLPLSRSLFSRWSLNYSS